MQHSDICAIYLFFSLAFYLIWFYGNRLQSILWQEMSSSFSEALFSPYCKPVTFICIPNAYLR